MDTLLWRYLYNQEVGAMAQRFEVAKLLSQGLTFKRHRWKTGASTATIARVNKCLVYGADGYTQFERLDQKKEQKNTGKIFRFIHNTDGSSVKSRMFIHEFFR